jgi:selenocysteine-specific elongation factor
MFTKESDISKFAGLRVAASGGEEGRIEGSFGKSGKFKVYFPGRLVLPPADKAGQPTKITLMFKKYVFDTDKTRLTQ